ncbi:MAG: DUF4365 domain-containing protein [Planctomycetaceae bacterium]
MDQMTSDQIGTLGELIAAAALSRPVGGQFDRVLFRAIPLGDKYPTADFLVDLLEKDGSTIGFFLAQVKSTNALSGKKKSLPIAIQARGFNTLVRLPVPTYVIGVDIATDESYLIAAICERRRSLSHIKKSYNLSDDSVRIDLYEEVTSFWKAVRRIPHPTRFDS